MATATIDIKAVDSYSRELNDTRRGIVNLNKSIAENRRAAVSANRETKKVLDSANRLLSAEKRLLTAKTNELSLNRQIARQSARSYAQQQADLRSVVAGVGRLNDAYRVLQGLVIDAGISFAFRGGRQILDAALEVDTLRNTLTALTGSVSEANRRLTEFRNLARLPGIGFESAARAGIQFDNVNLSLRQSINLTRELGNVAALSGTRLEELSFNISQLISGGRFNQRDLREALNRAPLIGRALGSTIAEELNAELEKSGLQIGEFITRQLGTLARADATAASNVFNNFTIALRDLSAQIGQLALPSLTEGIRRLTSYIQNNSENVVRRFSQAFELVRTVVGGVINNFSELAGLLTAGGISYGFLRATQAISKLNQTLGAGSTILIRFTNIFGRLTLIGAGISAVFAGIQFIKFIRGIQNANRATQSLNNRIEKLTKGFIDLESSATRAGEAVQLVGRAHDPRLVELTRRLQELQDARTDLQSQVQDVRVRFRVSGADDLEAIRDEITRRRDISAAAGAENSLRIQERQLAEINTLIKAQTKLEQGISNVRKQITTQTQQDTTAKEKNVEKTKEQLALEKELAALRDRAAARQRSIGFDLQNRSRALRFAEVEAERESSRVAQQRQTAIAQDLGRQASVRRQHRQNELQSEVQFQRDVSARTQAIAEDMDRRAALRSRHRVNQARTESEEKIRIKLREQEILLRIEEGADRAAIRAQEVAEQGATGRTLDDIRAEAAEQGNRYVLRLQDRFRRDLQRKVDDQYRIYERFYRRVGNLAVDAAFGRLRSAKEFLQGLAEELLRSFIRIQISEAVSNAKRLAVDTAFTNAKIANIRRVEKAQKESRIGIEKGIESFLPNLSRFDLGGLASGGAGALSVSALLFPNEFQSLFSEIGNTISEGIDVVKNAGPNIGTIRFDDGTARKVTSRSTQSGYGRKHFRG